MAQVDLDGIGKLYGTTRVIQDVSFTIEDGEFLVLVGPSGCGKSTLLRMVAGLEEISEGELRIGPDRANETQPKDRDIAMVFQSYALYPHMTSRQNMAFGLKVRKMPQGEIDRRVDAAAELLEIGPLLDRLPKDMSGGQRQRVAMGRAIVRQPKVFLFDEPLSNLDAALRTQMRGELKGLHRRLKTTMIYVTHDQVEAMTLADRIAVLKLGVLQQVGTPAQLFGQPANRFVAGFIGSPAMNFLDVSLDEGEARGPDFTLSGLSLPQAESAVLGVRPHDLRLADSGLPGHVVLIEPLGWEGYLHTDVGGVRVVARLEASELSDLTVGDTVHLQPDPAAVHWFARDEEGLALPS